MFHSVGRTSPVETFSATAISTAKFLFSMLVVSMIALAGSAASFGASERESQTRKSQTAADSGVESDALPLVRPLAKPVSPKAGFAAGFKIDADQTLVFLGGTNAMECGRLGYLETLLTLAHSKYKLSVRNMAWQADTVYEQQRPRNFFADAKPSYGERDGRKKTEADIIFVWMGQAESLQGVEKVDEFETAYEESLKQLATYTERIVLVTSAPFDDPLNIGLDVEARNRTLAKYVDVIKRIGESKNLTVVDLFSELNTEDSQRRYTTDGLHLSKRGHWLAAQVFAKQLGFVNRIGFVQQSEVDSALRPHTVETLRQAIGQKNDLWYRYWRPTNWAFLYGNRQSQPSSRDHKKSDYRWFPEELRTALPKIRDAEQSIQQQAAKIIQQL